MVSLSFRPNKSGTKVCRSKKQVLIAEFHLFCIDSWQVFFFDFCPMKPIRFSCQQFIPLSPQEISNNIADMARWEEFTGYGVLPGIKEAKYGVRTEEMIGSRIQVQNTDGSSHVEEIYTWEPDKAIGMKLCDFSPPLNKIATHFLEDWAFESQSGGTQVQRSFQLFPVSIFTRPFLWIISLFFRKAIAHHLLEMAQSGE